MLTADKYNPLYSSLLRALYKGLLLFLYLFFLTSCGPTDEWKSHSSCIAGCGGEPVDEPQWSQPWPEFFEPPIDAVDPTIITAEPAGGTYYSIKEVTLSANEPAYIYYSIDGNDPSVGGSDTKVGFTTVSVTNIPAGTTVLKYFAIDLFSNKSAVFSETYVVDVVLPNDVDPTIITAEPAGGTYYSIPQVTLSANEPAYIYYSIDGNDPSVGGSNTKVGFTPVMGINIPAGTTVLKYFAIDQLSNKSAVFSETYVVDVVLPIVSFVGDAPSPIGLLETTSIQWWSNESGSYVIEIGGDGWIGTGKQIATGVISENSVVTNAIPGGKLSFAGVTDIWVHVTNAAGNTGSKKVSLSLKPVYSISLSGGNGFGAYGGLYDGIKTNSTGTRLYVLSDVDASLKIIDIDKSSSNYNKEIASITVGTPSIGTNPSDFAITHDDLTIYVVSSGYLVVSDTTTNSVVSTISLPSASGTGIAITPDDERAYVHTSDGFLQALDINSASVNYHTVVDNIFIERRATIGNIEITSDGKKALLAWSGSANALEVIDIDPSSPSYNTSISRPFGLTAGGSYTQIILYPDNQFLYLSSLNCRNCKIDLTDYSVLYSIPPQPYISRTAIMPDGNNMIGVGLNEKVIYVIDANDLRVLGNSSVVGSPLRIIVTPDATRAYVIRHNEETNTTDLIMIPLI